METAQALGAMVQLLQALGLWGMVQAFFIGILAIAFVGFAINRLGR